MRRSIRADMQSERYGMTFDDVAERIALAWPEVEDGTLLRHAGI